MVAKRSGPGQRLSKKSLTARLLKPATPLATERKHHSKPPPDCGGDGPRSRMMRSVSSCRASRTEWSLSLMIPSASQRSA